MPFPLFFCNMYIFFVIDYDIKWVEVVFLPTNYVILMEKFVKKQIFTSFRTPREITGDGLSHFVNKWYQNLLATYGARH